MAILKIAEPQIRLAPVRCLAQVKREEAARPPDKRGCGVQSALHVHL